MKIEYVFLILFLVPLEAASQEDILNIGTGRTGKGIDLVTGTFMSTKLINGESVENLAQGELNFSIGHRFGTLNTGLYQFFGLDQANTHLGLDYGITDRLMIGIGRGSYEKTVDGLLKILLLRQSEGAGNMPLSLSLFTSMAIRTLHWEVSEPNNNFSARLSYTGQLLLARKFSNILSLEILPTFIHRNLVPAESDPNDLWSLGAGGRIRLTGRIDLCADYFYIANRKTYFSEKVYNPLSVGINIETAGHVFTLLLTNSPGMIEKAFIGGTTGSWLKGDIHFGFNISRVFVLKSLR